MRIEKASGEHFNTVRAIVRETITAVYPRYYPKGAVDFFLAHHHDAGILEDIERGRVYVFSAGGAVIGTGSVKENEIYRLFVLPAFQGRGFGREFLDFMEKMLFAVYGEIRLDASLPAQSMYIKRGYEERAYHKLPANGDYLCYYEMRLKRE
ncbi:Ribosomal protein S18 acetylase RimI [Sporobacter termitidis DSM 10068]|uniref:Ribosomal protein S18 acetylase RimI n=1 Tax=Sporobacter termitidis DSM 10068 TaxID=1123282 RepID=A0A1M5VMF0_9FIRM|nr:GNAT family N-acetyltransferase [Sporobacter termitidis]SHH76421.1 Ribosomal protein S18 acetylase RimI [Sporobacter termitidis DSM 10068]